MECNLVLQDQVHQVHLDLNPVASLNKHAASLAEPPNRRGTRAIAALQNAQSLHSLDANLAKDVEQNMSHSFVEALSILPVVSIAAMSRFRVRTRLLAESAEQRRTYGGFAGNHCDENGW